MNKLLLTVAGLAVAAAAAPAFAQYSPDSYWSASRDRRIVQLDRRVDDGLRRGLVTRRESTRLVYELSDLRRRMARYGRDGFTSWERGEVDRNIDRVRADIRMAEEYANGIRVYRSPEYGWDDTGAYARRGWDDDRWDRDNDGYGDRDFDRDGRLDDDRPYDDRPYDDRPYVDPGAYGDNDALDNNGDGHDDRDVPSAGDDDYVGVGGPFDVNADGGLGIGDAAPSNLGSVPYQFRDRYRDGEEVYYRYRDGSVYQIDRRTDTILWVGQLPY